jgi:hypothetical protein
MGLRAFCPRLLGVLCVCCTNAQLKTKAFGFFDMTFASLCKTVYDAPLDKPPSYKALPVHLRRRRSGWLDLLEPAEKG